MSVSRVPFANARPSSIRQIEELTSSCKPRRQVAFVEEVRLDVLRRWSLRPHFVFVEGVSSSSESEIVLPVMRDPYSVSAPAS